MALWWSARAQPAVDRPDPVRSLFSLPIQWMSGGDDYASVDAASGETSLQSVAVRATADLICSLASELPVGVYQDDADGRVKRPTPPNLMDPGGDGHGLEDWTYRLLLSWLMRGNAYGNELEWDRRGRALRVDLVHPDDVQATVLDGSVRWVVGGRVLEPAAADRFQHHRVNPVAGRVLGLSPIGQHAATINVSLQATRYGSQWFRDGAHPGGILSNTETQLSAEQAQTAKKRFLAALSGTREPLVMGKGWAYSSIQVAPEESQFLETMGFTEAQCARLFGPGFAEVMGYETGGSMTYANVVDRRQDLLVLSMNKWLRRVERVLSTLVPPKQYVRLNRDALLESTTLARYQAHALALRHRWRTINEVRRIEDEPPVPWGDEPAATAQPAQPAPGEPTTQGSADGNAA